MGFWDKLFSSSSQPTSAPQRSPEKPWYTASLKMTVPSYYSPPMLFCKDGIVYDSSTPSENRTIGYYQEKANGGWDVFCDSAQKHLIGSFSVSSLGDINIFLTLHGEVTSCPWKHTAAVHSPHGILWCAAECLTSGTNAIIDKDSYEPLGYYQGNPVEAAAAFIAWAYESHGNKYNDYFKI